MDIFLFFMLVLAILVAVQCSCLTEKSEVASNFDYFLFGNDTPNQ